MQKIEKNDELDNPFEMCALFVSSRMKKKNEIQASRERIISNSFSRDVSGANEIRKLPARRPPCDWLRLG